MSRICISLGQAAPQLLAPGSIPSGDVFGLDKPAGVIAWSQGQAAEVAPMGASALLTNTSLMDFSKLFPLFVF